MPHPLLNDGQALLLCSDESHQLLKFNDDMRKGAMNAIIRFQMRALKQDKEKMTEQENKKFLKHLKAMLVLAEKKPINDESVKQFCKYYGTFKQVRATQREEYAADEADFAALERQASSEVAEGAFSGAYGAAFASSAAADTGDEAALNEEFDAMEAAEKARAAATAETAAAKRIEAGKEFDDAVRAHWARLNPVSEAVGGKNATVSIGKSEGGTFDEAQNKEISYDTLEGLHEQIKLKFGIEPTDNIRVYNFDDDFDEWVILEERNMGEVGENANLRVIYDKWQAGGGRRTRNRRKSKRRTKKRKSKKKSTRRKTRKKSSRRR